MLKPRRFPNHLGSLSTPPVQAVLARCRDRGDLGGFLKVAPRIAAARLMRRPVSSVVSPGQLAAASMALPVSTGHLLYLTARAIGARQMVEFGTSFGVSLIHLACAVRDNGGGRVIGTEIEPEKAAIARANLAACGLADYAEVRTGDATETLARDVPPLDMVLLDGWKNLYVDMLRLLTPALRPGGVVLADHLFTNGCDLGDYLELVTGPDSGFVSCTLPIGDGIVYSVREAPGPVRLARDGVPLDRAPPRPEG